MEEERNPAPPEIRIERDRLTIRYGNTEVIQTKDCVIGRMVNTNRPDSGPTDDSSRQQNN